MSRNHHSSSRAHGVGLCSAGDSPQKANAPAGEPIGNQTPSAAAGLVWHGGDATPCFGAADIAGALERVREPAYLVRDPSVGNIGLAVGGAIAPGTQGWPLHAMLPPLYPEWLGDRSFGQAHATRFPYVTGAMANGIATTRLVIEMGRAGFLGFFGAAGLALPRVQAAVAELQQALGTEHAWGANLIHSPHEPALENAVAEWYVQQGVRNISAAAFMSLTPAVVRASVAGLRQDPQGRIVRARHVFAKISRPEVARHFLEPAPQAILDVLLNAGQITRDEAQLARHVPVAEDITVESDSGGHTDNRPLAALFPSILALREELVREHGYTAPIRIGAAGGMGTPTAVAAAFGLGAAYVVTGSVNQACVESGLAENGRRMLAAADVADVIMCPAADMFEMGVEVQVLRRGTMFGVRGKKLYELYRSYDSLEAVPQEERTKVEQQMLRSTFEEAWASTRAFWAERDPREVERAEADPHHRMALVFRSYLGQASRWAIAGDGERRSDYQIWCGPAMGAFNQWVKGSFLEPAEQRAAVQVARNLMEGAAVVTRAQQLRSYGAPVPAAAFDYRPRPLS